MKNNRIYIKHHAFNSAYSEIIKGSKNSTDAFKELGIKDEQDLSTLHDSKFIKIELDGTHECFVLTSEGIRYMDNQ